MDNSKVLIIAEAGVNHNGNIDQAKRLIDVAVECGVDIVKFQTFKAENIVTKTAKMANYQIDNTKTEESQLKMLKKLELNEEEFLSLVKYCHEKKIKFFSTGFDLESLAFLKKLNIGLWKIPSGEITNLPYLEFIGKLNEPIILSSGMCTLKEVEEAILVLEKNGTKRTKITVLHCNTDYPTVYEDVNLNSMLTIKNELGVKIGYSDHTEGVEVSVAAVALGARIIEKHFTLDKNLPGPDHKASLNPLELKTLVSQVRNIEKALGSFEKKPSTGEFKNMLIARKSLVAKQAIRKGDLFSMNNIGVKRPGNGISPMKWYEVVGTSAPRDFCEDELIEL